MKTAIIHYWLVNDRGGEKVLAKLCEQFPDADLFTHVCDPAVIPDSIRRMNIHTTFIQKLPFAKKLYKNYLPLMPLALRRLDLSGYDLIISSESGPAKGIRKPAGATHICYCHTPMRYLWDLSGEYAKNASLLQKIGMKLFLPWLRKWDLWSAAQVDRFIANSQFVADRIKRIYGRDAEVVYPPLDVEHFQTLERDPRDFYLFFGQLTAYKRADLAIEAFNRLGLRLVVAGDGECFQALEKFGGPTVELLGRVSDEKRDELYSKAKALIFPGLEDFGIIPVEAQAAGCPVIAFGQGGALETVIDGKTGVFFNEQTADSLCAAVEKFQGLPALRELEGELFEAACRENAARFANPWKIPA
ncbi:MAG: glycosyltransferase [Kiritimatiellales bacterium]|nr:glycosyltransferase [Kiritimatiellales bacterium]